MRAPISRRFDGWVSAKCCLAAVAEPPRRWRPHPSNPLMRRRVSSSLALDEREYKADGTSRDRPHCHRPAVNGTDLSKRELEVLKEIAMGHTNKEIGEKLFVSENTVKTHINNIYLKLEGSNSQTEMIFKHGLIDSIIHLIGYQYI